MATPFAKGGNMLFSQVKTALVDTARFRSIKLQEGEFNDESGRSNGWQICGYYNSKDIEHLATYREKETAEVVEHDLCHVMRNGEVADFTIPPDPEKEN